MDTLADFRSDAKRWLERLREHDPDAILRLKRAYPDASNPPTLRDVQHALAREEGYESWIALKAGIAEVSPSWWRAGLLENETTRVAKFLDLACWDHRTHGRMDFAAREAAAVALLRKHPRLARHDLYTAIVCGDVDEVQRHLDARPELINRKGGSRRWEPLLYLTYARLPADAAPRNALRMATLLLDRGANPNAYYMALDAFYSVLVGVAGEGEQEAPHHPERDALYALLIDRGADPFDMQVLYNTHFSGDVLWWLKLAHEHARRQGRMDAWNDPEWRMLDMRAYGSGARFLLSLSIRKNNVELARWLLEHGASANAAPAPHPKSSRHSLYEEAVRAGCIEIAALLRRHGAAATLDAVDDDEAYLSACLGGDRTTAAALLERKPSLRSNPASLFAAARTDDVKAAELVLDLGTPVQVQDDQQQTALHVAAAGDARRVVKLLLSRGADANVRERQWHATPLGYAVHHGRDAVIDLLVPLSTDVWNLVYLGRIDRLRAVLAESPERAREKTASGMTPLFWLPVDDERAVEAVELLLAHGVDPGSVADQGPTAEQIARERGLERAAARLAQAVSGRHAR